MKYLFICLSFLFIINCAYGQEYLLKGSIGKSAVVMDISVYNGIADVTYFHTSTCTDNNLKGGSWNGKILLYSIRKSFVADRNGRDTTEQMELQQRADKTWTGWWADNKGKKYAVTLVPVDVGAIKHPYAELPTVKEFKALEPYEYVRSSLLPVVKNTAPKVNGKYKLQYFRLKGTKIELFTIADGLDKAVAPKVNALLMDKFVEAACSYGSCASSIGAPNYDYTINNVYLSDNVLSVNVVIQCYCKGEAYPDAGEEPINIDLKTGRELVLEDVLHLTEMEVPMIEEKKWKEYRQKIYSPRLLALLTGLYPKSIGNKDDCDYSGTAPWMFPEWYITKKGVYVSPFFPREIAPCRNPEWSYIPFDVLSKYKHPKKQISLP